MVELDQMLWGEVSDIESALRFLIVWPLSAPLDAYRSGSEYGIVAQLLIAVFPGLPILGIRLLIGPLLAAFNYYRSQG
jgi:hypothetical protein